MSKHYRISRKNKQFLPYPDFPLSPHVPSGLWYKTIRGHRFYFGKITDWQAALDKYNAEKDYLHAGKRPPTSVASVGLTMADLCNRFLTSWLRKQEAGELKARTFGEYKTTTDRLVAQLGGRLGVADLNAEDFSKLRVKLADQYGPVRLGNEIQRVRTVFKFAYDSGLIDRPVRFGPDFVKPPRRVMRLTRSDTGSKMLTAEQVQNILAAAAPQIKAMILLGVNAGFGATDVAELPLDALDLDGGWLDFRRPKTGIDRRAPLWAETVKALREAIEQRPKPAAKEDEGLVFITPRRGERWVRYAPGLDGKMGRYTDGVGHSFGKLLDQLGIDCPGRFYNLRHTFETVAGETKDQPAVDRIMGHADESMAAVYREWTRDERENTRLLAVTDHVHRWLYSEVVEEQSA